MFNQLTALGIGVVVFALVIGVGTIVLQSFNVATACSSGYTFNTTSAKCYETANTSHIVDPSTSGTSVNTLQGYLGTSSGGLASWTPAIIALVVGLLFIGALITQKGRSA